MRMGVMLWVLFSLFVMAENNGTSETTNDTKAISIQGAKEIPASEYLNALGVPQKSWFQFWKQDKPIIAKKSIPTVADTLRDFLDSKGYYDAKIHLQERADQLRVTIDEEKPVMVSDLQIDTDFNIPPVAGFQKGTRFEAAKFVRIKQEIKELLMKAGYCNYQLDTKAYVDLVKRTVSLKYLLKKGELCHFGETRIVSKPEDISEKVIRSRLRYKKGEVFSTEKINRTFSALNSLDAFGSGTVSPKEQEGEAENPGAALRTVIPMEINLSPKEKLNLFKGGIGYDTALGMRLQLYYERRNFTGEARKLTSTLHYSDKSQYGEVTLFSPALIALNGDYFDFYSEFGFAHRIYDAYNENNGYLRTKLTYEREDITVALGLGIENIDIKKTAAEPSIIEGNFLLMYPFANFVYDGRDSKINPKNGYYFSAYTEYGVNYKPSASSYYKFLLEGRLIKTFEKLTLAAVGKIGVVEELSHQVPASKLFYAGGAYSNRAYGEYDIGYILSPVASSVLGGKTWLNFSVEADYPLYDALYGALFFDSTMINKNAYDFKGESINSAGVGLRYLTPIGPIKLDIGANIEDSSQYGISFQIGQSF